MAGSVRSAKGVAEAATVLREYLRALALLGALGRASWRDVRSFGSLAGQNFFMFVLLVAYQQAESAEFFFVILVAVILIPLSADALDKIPQERRLTWPLSRAEWAIVRAGSLVLNPIAWLVLVVLLKTGWRMGLLAAVCAAILQALTFGGARFARRWPISLLPWIPAPPGTIGAIMRLQWRGMLRTLDPYAALVLLAVTEIYKAFGKPVDPHAWQIISLVITLAMSTQTQVLFAVDGAGAERYRQVPLKGWQILLAKDLAFLSLTAAFVLPLDFVSGFAGAIAVLSIGHHRSVLKIVPQQPWRFTSGALLPDGLLQFVALFAIGLEIRNMPVPLATLCLIAWIASLLFYGWQWDCRRYSDEPSPAALQQRQDSVLQETA